MLTVPAGAFAASLLFDMLSLVAATPEQADSYERRAADLLRLAVGNALTSVAIDIADYLRTPPSSTPPAALRRFAVNGTIIAIYLLDVAEREKQVGDGHARAGAAPLGLSLAGLVLSAVSG
jgi:hypothetical protein